MQDEGESQQQQHEREQQQLRAEAEEAREESQRLQREAEQSATKAAQDLVTLKTPQTNSQHSFRQQLELERDAALHKQQLEIDRLQHGLQLAQEAHTTAQTDAGRLKTKHAHELELCEVITCSCFLHHAMFLSACETNDQTGWRQLNTYCTLLHGPAEPVRRALTNQWMCRMLLCQPAVVLGVSQSHLLAIAGTLCW